MAKLSPSKIGFLQALGVVAYCGLVAGLLRLLSKTFLTPPELLGSIFILVLLVFSAAVSGSIVFGYPAYLALNQKIREALTVLFYTLAYSLGFLAIIIILLTVIR